MSIVGQIVVESRRYSGWTDPRYPIGFWQAALAVTGDVSGGLLGIDLVFQLATAARLNSQMYSVERFTITSTDNTDRHIQLTAPNMGGPANKGFTHEYAITMNAMDTPADGAMDPTSLNLVPWFLGSQRIPGVTASLTLVTDNLDGITFELEAEGYRWSARSVLVNGGPQRPPTGLYRQ